MCYSPLGLRVGLVFWFQKKKVYLCISKPLTYIFNWSLATGIITDRIKVAKVIPIFKKGDAMNCDYYRTVSILTCFSKYLKDLSIIAFV